MSTIANKGWGAGTEWCRREGFGLRVTGFGFRVGGCWNLVLSKKSFGFRVSGFGFRVGG